ncbi:unnamed protein product [Peronospora effusa]|nr:unnamed protein product [Peronospora effusa]
MSTVVKSVTFNQEDVPAYGLGVKTTNEERTLGSPVVEKAAEEITSNVPESLEGVLNLQNEMEKLRLGEDKSIMDNPHFNDWVRDLAKTIDTSSAAKEVITKVSEPHGDEGLLKMLDALEKDEVGEVGGVLQGELKSALMASWENQYKSAGDVFKLLKLDMKPDPTHPINVKRLSLWVQYVEKNVAMPGKRMADVIDHYDLDFALMVYNGLRGASHKDAAKALENSLVDQLLYFESGSQDQDVQVFKKLELDNGLDKLLDKPNFDLFYRYAAHFQPEWTKEAVFIKAARTVYEDIPLGKMLEAASKNDHTARLLLQELDKRERMDAYLKDQLSLSLEELPPSHLANAHV